MQPSPLARCTRETLTERHRRKFHPAFRHHAKKSAFLTVQGIFAPLHGHRKLANKRAQRVPSATPKPFLGGKRHHVREGRRHNVPGIRVPSVPSSGSVCAGKERMLIHMRSDSCMNEN